jgi:hypothetical protein
MPTYDQLTSAISALHAAGWPPPSTLDLYSEPQIVAYYFAATADLLERVQNEGGVERDWYGEEHTQRDWRVQLDGVIVTVVQSRREAVPSDDLDDPADLDECPF